MKGNSLAGLFLFMEWTIEHSNETQGFQTTKQGDPVESSLCIDVRSCGAICFLRVEKTKAKGLEGVGGL